MAAASNTGQVNINSDLGESFGPWVMGNDAEVLKIVKSANVACGFHASDPVVMVDTVRLPASAGSPRAIRASICGCSSARVIDSGS